MVSHNLQWVCGIRMPHVAKQILRMSSLKVDSWQAANWNFIDKTVCQFHYRTVLWSPCVIGQTMYIFILWFVLSFFFMVALWNRADHYIFALWLLLSFFLSFFFFSLPNLSRRRLDICHTSTHGVALVRISDSGLKPAARGSLKTQDAKKSPKIAIWAPSHNFVGLYLRNEGTYWQSEKSC